jgi:hypothetical protein
MDLSKIVSISGTSGLFKIISQIKNGFIAESLLDKKRIPVYSSQKVSTLEDISVYTTGEDVLLRDVYKKFMEKLKEDPAIDHKAPDEEVKKFFETNFPEYDKDRVYVSDMRKMINWYNILQKNDLLKEKEEEKQGEEKDAVKIKPEEKAKISAKAKPVKSTSQRVNTAGVKRTASVRKTGSA